MTLTYYRKRGEPTTELETCAARGVGTKDIVLIETGNRSKPESKTGPVPITSAHHFFISKEYYPPPQEIAQMASLFTFYFLLFFATTRIVQPVIIKLTSSLYGYEPDNTVHIRFQGPHLSCQFRVLANRI